ncbi:hypothetical protein JOQ06_002991 [Pogonophryne albipinna]|uniref:Uncharacterized protein n=1 Tax=Pogonophryne albipinna TaxID=1090488 RepID=A0AAD6FK62_9TELE|nr:hypothetical protein JOQ06_002991 [Pogonophryne albipinna]
MVAKRCKMTTTEGMDLPEDYMAEVQDCNKNLGIPQRNGHHYEARGKAATAKDYNSANVSTIFCIQPMHTTGTYVYKT